MTLHINGQAREFPDSLTLAALVAALAMKTDRVAVELNLEIVPQASWESTVLKDGDRLEIVHFVGGGSGAGSTEVTATAPQPNETVKWSCPTCFAEAGGAFCSSCGEKKVGRHDLSVGHLLAHAGETLFHWDSKVFRTFRVLLTQPGALSDAYVKGRRKAYVHPFQVFVITNVLYFFLYPFLGWSGLKATFYGYQHWMNYSGWATRLAIHRAAALGISMQELGQRFDHLIDVQSRSLVLLMVPLFAGALAVLEWRRKRHFGEHLVFSLHFMAAVFLGFFIGLAWLSNYVVRGFLRFGIDLRGSTENHILVAVSALVFGSYLFVALRRFYQDSKWMALFKAVLLLIAFDKVQDIYQIILFLTALYSA